MNEQIKSKLKKCYAIYQSSNYRVYRLGNELLQEILSDYKQKPRLDKAIQFITCLNHFYSTRIQIGKGSINDDIVRVAKIFDDNWVKGVKLHEVMQGENIKAEKVDKLSKLIEDKLGVRLFSLATKILHHLNTQYPIYDSLVNQFLKKDLNIGRIALNKKYTVFYDKYMTELQKIGWNENDVLGFDKAIWILVKERKKMTKAV